MCPNPRSEDLEMKRADHKIPQEITRRESLDQAACAGVAVYSLDPAALHVVSLLIAKHDPQCQRVDET